MILRHMAAAFSESEKGFADNEANELDARVDTDIVLAAIDNQQLACGRILRTTKVASP